MSHAASVEPRPTAQERILLAARALVARGGAAEISMGDVATRAGVSKALVHYHFQDKDTLMRALAEAVGADVVARTDAAIRDRGSGSALDAYWTWLSRELEIGDVRILVSLAEYDSEAVRRVSRDVATRRRALSEAHAAAVFTALGLTPRVPAGILADTLLAFIDGLAVSHALQPDRDTRPAFDALWLALLTLVD